MKQTITLLINILAVVTAFCPLRAPISRVPRLKMSSYGDSLVLSAQPTIEDWLEVLDPKLRRTCLAMFQSCKEIAYKIRSASCDQSACFNEFGDEQLAIDILANSVIFNKLRASGTVATASSEENPTEDAMGGQGFSVAFDPLAGSGVIDTNFAVGTSWGVWPGSKLTNIKGDELAAAGIAVYGPRTTMTIAVSNMDYAHEFVLVDDFSARHGQWIKSNEFTAINDGKLFAPGNMRALEDNVGYGKIFDYWVKNNYQMRLTGGTVPDVNQLLVKGKGIFVNVDSKKSKSKLRLLYDLAPIAFLIEKAGGWSSDGERSILTVDILDTEQMSQAAFGSPKEVERFEKVVGRQYL